MFQRYLLPTALLLALPVVSQAVEPSDLKPGLLATFSESPDGASGVVITRLEPTVAATWNAGESPHPRMARNGLNRWQGYINVVRGGKYTFSATVRGGEFQASVDGKVVVAASADNQAAVTKSGAEVTLEGGVVKFEATFIRKTGDSQIELIWQGPGFRPEPLPHQFLGHLPKERTAQFTKDLQLERGRFAFEELACAKCHRPAAENKMAKGLADRSGPNLTDVAKRSHAGWIDAWLADPAKLREHTAMPKMFSDDDAGKAERYAVTQYLIALAGSPLAPVKAPLADGGYNQSMERGRVLFSVTGCAACHANPIPKKAGRNDEEEKEPLKPEDYAYSAGTTAPAAKYALGALGSKYTPATLAAFLQNPLKSHPSGRMPQMNLSPAESLDLARYLCRVTDETFSPAAPIAPRGVTPTKLATKVYADFYAAKAADELPAFEKLSPSKQWIDLGEKLVVTRGCVNCHSIESNGKKRDANTKFPSLEQIQKAAPAKGCLSEKADAAKSPVYALDAAGSAALAAFLKDGLKGAGAPAPTHSARLSVRRFNCLNCHSKDGEGGISVELADQMRLMEKAENADDVRPPLLTGIGHKSRTVWLKAVLMQGGRARPWMQLRMPQYGESNLGALPEALIAMEGTVPDDNIKQVPIDATKIAAGRAIVGKGGLGCISCHDIAGVANTGTRGPDLSTINQRVRYDWYVRWLHQPLRMAPGTRMPQAFVDNKSTLATVLNGDPDKQAEAMWAYLSLGPSLPLPEGLEPPKGLLIAVKDRPELLRTFMPDAGTKAIAVGYPGGTSIAFSADQCRLSYAWAGNFLDASPVWNNRGGAPAKLLGVKFWNAPPGHPWGMTANPKILPDFLARVNHPAFGAPLPLEPARIYDLPRAVQFDGYSLDKDGQPTFRYTLTEGKNAVLRVVESPIPMRGTLAPGLIRRFALEAPGGYQTWLLAGLTTKEPRLATPGGEIVPLDLKAREVTAPANGARVILPEGDRATVLELVAAPIGTTWRFAPRTGGGWLAVVRLPESAVDLNVAFAINVWSLPKDDDQLLKGLAAE